MDTANFMRRIAPTHPCMQTHYRLDSMTPTSRLAVPPKTQRGIDFVEQQRLRILRLECDEPTWSTFLSTQFLVLRDVRFVE